MSSRQEAMTDEETQTGGQPKALPARRVTRLLAKVTLDLSPIRSSRDYRVFWISQVASLTGSQMTVVALAAQAYLLRHNSLDVGIVSAAQLVALVVGAFVGGHLGDRVNRRTMLVTLQVAQGLCMVALAFGTGLLGLNGLLFLVVLASVLALCTAMDEPVRDSLVPSLLRDQDLEAGQVLNQTLFQITSLAGPLVGGVVLSLWDLRAVYVVDALTFAVAAVGYYLLRTGRGANRRSTAASGPVLRSLLSGIRFFLRHPLIQAIAVIDLIAMVFGMPRALFPQMVTDYNGWPSGALGLLFTAPSLGALLVGATGGWIGRVQRQGLGVMVSVGVWGLAIAATGLVLNSLWTVLLLLLIAGAADTVSAILRVTMTQRHTPVLLRSRVNALFLLFVVGGPRLGDIEAGAMAHWGLQFSIVSGGLLCLVGVAITAVFWPGFAHYRRRTRATDKDFKEAL
ncbi:MFS transporter [Streptomyces fuscichromogenes]|uniref:MFS transporter n=1 Tax=Streptomyces fuscichromogenes TaxID=1324013 RepID=UPI00382B4FA1